MLVLCVHSENCLVEIGDDRGTPTLSLVIGSQRPDELEGSFGFPSKLNRHVVLPFVTTVVWVDDESICVELL